MDNEFKLPKRIICMTEESAELLYAIGEEDRIIGVSAYAKRPAQISEKKKVCAFIKADVAKIVSLKPDLVIGYSDLQKNIAADLISAGVNVFISNHRSLEEVLNYCLLIGSMVGKREEALVFCQELKAKKQKAIDFSNELKKKPLIHIEEWDEPLICGIKYFSELVELCGGVDVNKDYSENFLGKDRILEHKSIINKNPDIILASWCGKKVDIDSIKNREGWENVKAVQNSQVYELPPEIFLQPGPSLFVDGIDFLLDLYKKSSF